MNGMFEVESGFSMSSLVTFKLLSDSMYLLPNPYLEEVNIPTYDGGEASHLLITVGNGNWTSANLNNATYKHFYVEAGDYSSSSITLTTSGTELDRRSISLYNANDTHPASLLTAEQADVKIIWDGASYWDIDRISFLSYQAEVDVTWFNNSSNYNTLNRINLKDYYYGILIARSSSYNTIQNSYIDHMTHAGRLSDNVGIALQSIGATAGTPSLIYGTKIINNDIRNTGDGIQLVRKEGDQENAFYNGTIIDSNRIWNDGDIYTNGDYATNGYNPNGEYQIGENAMDFKQGSSDPNNQVIVSNNIMWGYREGDSTAGGSQTAGAGGAFPVHFGVSNVLFSRNIIFDSMDGFTSGNRFVGQTYSIFDCTFRDNIMCNMYHVNPLSRAEYPHFFNYASNIIYENNSIIDVSNLTGTSNWFRYEYSGSGNTFNNNLVIDCEGVSRDTDAIATSGNHYYNTGDTMSPDVLDDETIGVSGTEAMGDYGFMYERFTITPKIKIIVGACTTDASPHNSLAGSDIS